MTNEPDNPSLDPPPHVLADWVHQRFLARPPTAITPTAFGTARLSLPSLPAAWAQTMLSQPITGLEPATPRDFAFSRKEIDRGLVGAAVDRLMSLSDTTSAVLHERSSLRLSFPDYLHDSRPLGDIQKIGNFIRKITTHWPYWLHFLAPEPDNLAVFLTLIAKTQHEPAVGDKVRARLSIHTERKLQLLAEQAIFLHEFMGLPHQITHDMGRALRDGLCRTFI